MKFKDLKPKYRTIELLIDSGSFIPEYGVKSDFEVLKSVYGKHEVLSTKNFDDIKTTSIIISKHET